MGKKYNSWNKLIEKRINIKIKTSLKININYKKSNLFILL